ncbi:MAG: dipeptide/oligopeptide/nickel ABC transporter permease/ATP-binding protein [Chloroflexi bacterium]|nr:dipeptide/oligopeptide/nickel ABC transporter permease/ATP-binding protein [Chloroflexota bacterium]
MDSKTLIHPLPSALHSSLSSLRRNRMGLIGAGMLVASFVVAALASLIAPYDPKSPLPVTIDTIYAPPGPQHLLGTDDAGQDVLTNFIYGSRISLTVGFFASFISIVIGGVIGLAAGYFGGRIDNLLMRFTDIILVIPDLPLTIVLVALTKPSLLNIIIVIGIVGWTGSARLVRSQTIAVKERKFVVRARAIGAGHLRIIARHIFPLVLPLIVTNTVLVISLAILNESALSFLGLADPTTLSWGQMLNYAFTRGAMSTGAWWALVPPGFGIVWVVLACTLLGYGLEQILNPRVESHHLSVGAQMISRLTGRLSPLDSLPAASDRSHRAAPPDLNRAPVVLDVAGLSVDFVSESAPPAHAVSNVSFSLRQGELLGLVGESGCGKTTLTLALMRLLPAAGRIVGGEVSMADHDLLSLSEKEMEEVRWKDIAMIFQGAMNALNPVRTIGDQIAEAVLRRQPNSPQESVDRRVSELLELVGIAAARRAQYPHQYSGGMRQRAMIAMALACNPKVVIADEPTTALDVMIQAQILDLLARLRRQLGLSVIFITHDLGVVAEVCDTVLVMYGGVTAEYASVDTIFNNAQHPYTRELLKAFPDLSHPGGRLTSIPGYPPRLNALPPGCRFAPRCPAAFDRCHTEPPAIHSLSGFHTASCHLVENLEIGD